MTTEDLDHLERLDELATAGPWKFLSFDQDRQNQVIYSSDTCKRPLGIALHWPDQDFDATANAQITVAARNALPELLRLARIGLLMTREDWKMIYAALWECELGRQGMPLDQQIKDLKHLRAQVALALVEGSKS